MSIKKFFHSKLIQSSIGAYFISSFAESQAMLVNSKEIAQNVKTAIIEAGTQFSNEFKDVIETTKPLWPNKFSCLTSLGVICTAGGMLFLYQGLTQIIDCIGNSEKPSRAMQGFIRILTGILVCTVGIGAIFTFGS